MMANVCFGLACFDEIWHIFASCAFPKNKERS